MASQSFNKNSKKNKEKKITQRFQNKNKLDKFKNITEIKRNEVHEVNSTWVAIYVCKFIELTLKAI